MFKILIIGIIGILSSFLSGPEQISVDKINSTNLDRENYVYAVSVNIIEQSTQSFGDIVSGKKFDENCPVEKQCVSLLKEKGLNIKGNAQDIISNSNIPVLFGGVLLRSSRYGHVAYIEKIGDDYIEILEKNWLGCGIISTRSIQLDDPAIRGFVK